MKYIEKQKKIEYEVHESIDDIADELSFKLYDYPEVYWLGKKFNFNTLGISNDYEDMISDIIKNKNSMYLHDYKLILITDDHIHHKAEESGHYLHLNYANINFGEDRSDFDSLCLNSLIEMFGFFTSKLIDPKRKEPILRTKDRIPIKNLFHNKPKFDLSDEYTFDFLTYQQGYGLGQRLFNSYVSGRNDSFRLGLNTI